MTKGNVDNIMERTMDLCKTYIKLAAWLNKASETHPKFKERLEGYKGLVDELAENFHVLSMAELGVEQRKLFEDNYEKVLFSLN